MQLQLNAFLLPTYDFTDEELLMVRKKLSEPTVRAYIQNQLSGALLGIINQSVIPTTENVTQQILFDNAFNKGMIELGTKLIFNEPN